jgi:selenide,water dikinase
VGLDTADDGAVYRLTEELALVQSVDFFTAIVDDPYDFGRIAAANALSDIYAMGGRPVLALNLVAFSLKQLGVGVLAEIMRGAAEIAGEAGACVAGGHSIDDAEPKFGMAVTGVVHPDRILTNGGGQSGDELFLTKPLGVGLVTTGAKRGIVDAELLGRAIEVMTTLNGEASRAALEVGASAATDVTGFGLLGHLHELCSASRCSAEIDAAAVPLIEGVLRLSHDDQCISGGSRRNAEYAAAFTTFAGPAASEWRALLSDAMTSGGLLCAVPKDAPGKAPGVRIGRLADGEAGAVSVS